MLVFEAAARAAEDPFGMVLEGFVQGFQYLYPFVDMVRCVLYKDRLRALFGLDAASVRSKGKV